MDHCLVLPLSSGRQMGSDILLVGTLADLLLESMSLSTAIPISLIVRSAAASAFRMASRFFWISLSSESSSMSSVARFFFFPSPLLGVEKRVLPDMYDTMVHFLASGENRYWVLHRAPSLSLFFLFGWDFSPPSAATFTGCF